MPFFILGHIGIWDIVCTFRAEFAWMSPASFPRSRAGLIGLGRRVLFSTVGERLKPRDRILRHRVGSGSSFSARRWLILCFSRAYGQDSSCTAQY